MANYYEVVTNALAAWVAQSETRQKDFSAYSNGLTVEEFMSKFPYIPNIVERIVEELMNMEAKRVIRQLTNAVYANV